MGDSREPAQDSTTVAEIPSPPTSREEFNAILAHAQMGSYETLQPRGPLATGRRYI